MGPECEFSFRDLFIAAFGHNPTQTELSLLYALPQKERNIKVEEWAKLANWGTDKRTGTDGQVYTAFCPLWERVQ